MESKPQFDINVSPVLITGAPRSMTSATAGCLFLSGAFCGEVSGPNRNNQKGMFENAWIRGQVVKTYLREVLHVDPMGQKPLPDISKLVDFPALRSLVCMRMVSEGYRGGPWFYKGAKMCLIWKIWADAFPDAKWIIVRRDDESIIKSCLSTSFMRAYQDEKGWKYWLEVHKERFREMAAVLNVREVWPTRMIDEADYSEITETLEWCGLIPDEEAIRSFISPALLHHRAGKSTRLSSEHVTTPVMGQQTEVFDHG